MSFMSRLSAQDPVQLVRIAAAVSLTLRDVPGFSYNFPLMLFGVVALELSSTGPEQLFLMTTAFATFFDVLTIMTSPPSFPFHWIFAFGLFIVKAPIYFSGVAHLRERGGELSWGNRGFGGGGRWIPTSFVPGQTLGGQTLGGSAQPQPPQYQAPPPVPSGSTPPPPGAFPSGGYRLGGDGKPAPTRDGYSQIA